MPDDSELDYIRTFLGAVHTEATVKHFDEENNISLIADTRSMLVFPPEMLGSDGDDFYWKRYMVSILEESEIKMIDAINLIIIGIKEFNRRTAIDGFTRPATMCHIKFAYSSPAWSYTATGTATLGKEWACNIWIDIQWSTT